MLKDLEDLEQSFKTKYYLLLVIFRFEIVKKYFVPLIFIFLFSKAKAELYNSAFATFSIVQEQKKDTSFLEKKYFLAEKLYRNKDYSKALKYSYDLLEKSNNNLFSVKVNLLIGNIFKDTDYDRKAQTYYYEALSQLKGQIKGTEKHIFNYDELKSGIYLQLGALNYRKKNRIDSAIYYYEKNINIASINRNVLNNKAKSYGTLSSIYALPLKQDIEKAKKYAEKAIEIHKELNDSISLAADYGSLANIFVEEYRYKEAEEIYRKALQNLKSKTSPQAIKYKEVLYDNLAWCLYKLKDYRAYDYLDESISLKDSLKNLRHKKELAKLDLKYNMDILRKEEENKRISLERNNWLIGITGFAVSLLLLYLANVYKLRQRSLKLQLSKKELEQQRELDELKSESQVKIINAAIDGKETERKQIAETLHDNVSALLSSANMHLQATQKQFNGEMPIELKKTQDIILEASQKIRDLSHNLVSSVLLKFGLEYAVKDIAKKYSNSSIKIHTAISDVNRYSQDFEIKVFNIIQELLNNILKHSKAETAYVVMEEKNNILSIIVKDDGEGFEVGDRLKNGIGLNQIQARIKMLKGNFNIDSNVKKGTKISIDIPIIKRGF